VPMPFAFHSKVAFPGWRLLLVLAVLSTLNACSWFSGGDDETGDAVSLRPLEIPPDLVTPQGDPRLAQPTLPQTQDTSKDTSKATTSTPATADCRCNEPPRIGERVLPAGKGVQRMHEGQRHWLVVQAEPEQVWPLARKFLEMRAYRVARDEPAIGLLESDWKNRYADGQANDPSKANWRELLRIRIEPAQQAGYAEVYLSQRQSQRVAGDAADSTPAQWQLRPADEDRAIEMLNRLAQFLAAKDVSDAVPLQPLNVHLDTNADGHTVLVAEAGFEMVWRRTSMALDALGFTIEDHDQSNRIFHVYNDLPSGLTEEELKFGKPKSATVREEYWIYVQEQGNNTHISVRNKSGQVDESQVAKQVLTMLLGQLK